MLALFASSLLAFSVSGTVRAGAHALVDHLADDVNVGASHQVRAIVQQQEGADSESDDESDVDSDLEVVPPRSPGSAKLPRLNIQIGDDSDGDLPTFSESGHNVAAVDVLRWDEHLDIDQFRTANERLTRCAALDSNNLGTGYKVGDLLPVPGGTFTQRAVLKVTIIPKTVRWPQWWTELP